MELTNDDDLFVLCNGSISTARVNGLSIHFKLWDKGDTTAEPRKFIITPDVAPQFVWDYQINGNVALVKYESQDGSDHYDLWYLTEPEGYLISGYLPDSDHQPHCEPFLTAEESAFTTYCDWLLDTNSNSEYLVIPCSDESRVIFVVVFDRFTLKNGHRIQMPENLQYRDCLNMRIVGSGKDATTVLTAKTSNRYGDICTFFVYDLSNGETLLKIPLDRKHTSFGQYLFPTNWLTNEDRARGGVDVIRIDYNGKKWTTSTSFASYGHVEEYDPVRLLQVTDTQTLWQLAATDGGYSIVCDYLLTELDTRRLDNNDIILPTPYDGMHNNENI